jgi:hypothetical protein
MKATVVGGRVIETNGIAATAEALRSLETGPDTIGVISEVEGPVVVITCDVLPPFGDASYKGPLCQR